METLSGEFGRYRPHRPYTSLLNSGVAIRGCPGSTASQGQRVGLEQAAAGRFKSSWKAVRASLLSLWTASV